MIILTQSSLHHLYVFSFEVYENVLFELGNEQFDMLQNKKMLATAGSTAIILNYIE